MTPALTGALLAAFALPHLLPLRHAPPVIAAAIWASALALRALSVLFIAVYLVILLPRTELFEALTHWCGKAMIPLLASDGGLDGHAVGDAAVIVPSCVFAVLLLLAAGVVRAARLVRAALRRAAIGAGPCDSLIVGGSEVRLAAAGLSHPRIVVSAGALAALDDEELAAGLDHERGHIARRHRFVLVLAELCRGVARVVPGTSRALEELRFQLDRDADRWALARDNDPYALASAICKAAARPLRHPASLLPLADRRRATERVDELIGTPNSERRRPPSALLGAAAAVMAGLVLTLAVLLPVTAVAAAQHDHPPHPSHCER